MAYMRTKAPYKLFKRSIAAKRGRPGKRYYCRFLDPETGEYENPVSTGQTAEDAAVQWARARLVEREEARAAAGNGSVNPHITVADFATGFFDDDSAYMRHRAERGRGMGWNHQKHCAAYLRLYIIPFFGEMRVCDIDDERIERFQSWLLKQPQRAGRSTATLSPATANHVVQALRHVVKWAIKRKVLRHDPFLTVEPLASRPNRRGAFEPGEITAMFQAPLEAWGGDPLARMLHAVAASCGLRKGELQGITRDRVKEVTTPAGETVAAIVVDRSWSREGELKSTKSGAPRVVWIPPALSGELFAVMQQSIYTAPEHFVFHSVDGDRPMSHKKIDKDFTRIVRAIGISDAERRERRLSFHSLRHFANSYLINQGVPHLRAQQIIGHTSLRMTGNYLHPGTDQTDIITVTGRLFEGADND